MLSAEGCRSRQKRLAERLHPIGADGAVITHRDHVFYLTGWRAKWCHAAAAYVDANGRTTLVGAEAQEATAADEVIAYASNFMATMFSEQARRCAEKLRGVIPEGKRLAADLTGPAAIARLAGPEAIDLTDPLVRLRKQKDPDEVECIRRSVRVTGAMYRAAREHLAPGITELELFGKIRAAAVLEAGEVLEVMGNDFRSAADGIAPERAPKRLTLRDVPVTRLSLIGPETRRWRDLLYHLVGRSRLRMPDVAGALVDLLWSHAENQTLGDGVLLDDDVIAELLGDALVDARIGRAFRWRNEWAIATQRRLTYELAQEARWAKRSAARLAAIGRQVLGAHALLAAEDRRAPLDGRWEAFERQVLADANPAGGPEIDAETYAQELGVPLAGDERLRQTAEPGPIAARSTA